MLNLCSSTASTCMVCWFVFTVGLGPWRFWKFAKKGSKKDLAVTLQVGDFVLPLVVVRV